MPETFLSLHLPNFPQPLDGLDSAFLDPWIEWAGAMGVDDLTAHLPTVPASRFYDDNRQPAATAWVEEALRAYDRMAERAADMGARLSLENVYNKRRCEPDEEKLSSRPWHVARFIEELRSRRRGRTDGGRHIGMIFDAGHAFNDPLVSKTHGLADWIRECAPVLQLAHIHQVERDAEGIKRNHQPILDLHGPMINYEGFLSVIQEAASHPFPLLIEVRERDSALASLETLRQALAAGPPPPHQSTPV